MTDYPYTEASVPRPAWIRTFTGKIIKPLDPDPASICIEDIAHALANVCRYTGHVQRFYSVAEHSIWVSRVIEQRQPAQLWLARWGLLHDATEAYIADVSRPLKHLPTFSEYRVAESRLMAIIAEKFGLPSGEPAIVKAVDTEMLGTEVHQLLNHGADWQHEAISTAVEHGLADPIPLIGYLGLSPADAEQKFLERFRELKF